MKNFLTSIFLISLLQQYDCACTIEGKTGAGSVEGYYFEVNVDKRNKSQAQKFCENSGGWLGEPRTKTLNDGLKQIYNDNKLRCGMFYQGLDNIGGEWLWNSDGAKHNTYPKRNDRDTDTLFANCSTHGSALLWYDRICSKEERFVCQYKNCSTSETCRTNQDCANSSLKPALKFCKCKPGCYGKNCTDGYCEAITNPCKSRGTCISSMNATLYQCSCPPGIYGRNCTDKYCEVHKNPCKNSGQCTSNPGVAPYHLCICRNGYYGNICANGFCEEYPSTCKNGANCTSNFTSHPHYRCDCIAGYNGSNCTDATFHKRSPNTHVTTAVTVIGGAIGLLLLIGLAIFIKKRISQRKLKRSPDTELHVLDSNFNQTSKRKPKEHLHASAKRSVNPVYQNHGYGEKGKDTKTVILKNDLLDVYNSKQQSDSAGFSEEFQTMLKYIKGLSLTSRFASNPALKSKNRYKNILPFDETRVPLINNEDHYINACFIHGYEQKKKFIATQGPLKKTVNDFWQMIVEQETTVIVMLAKCIEAGKAKCEKYWPDLGATCRFGAIEITNLNETRSCGFVCRSLNVTTVAEGDTITRVVSQYHYLKWPDHGFPITTSHLIQMYRKVVKEHNRNGSKFPIVVHCSAGAGRTGTLIGYDILLNEIQSTGKANPFNCVINMRKQRMDMVQNRNQYILIHKLLLESQLFGDTDVVGRVVSETFSDSNYRSKITSELFQNLSQVTPMDMVRSNGVLSAYDRMRIKIQNSGSEMSNQLGASYVEVYDESSTVIVTKEPRKTDVNAFHKLLVTENVSTVVMITEGDDIFAYWNEDDFRFSSEEAYDNLTIRKLFFTTSEEQNGITHMHLRFNAQEVGRMDVARMNDCMKRMLVELRETSGVALVHCKNGMGMSGVFCAVMNLLERLKVEDRVDVFRAVKDLRDCRAGMVQSMKQFELCHEAILAYLEEFDTYSNFK